MARRRAAHIGYTCPRCRHFTRCAGALVEESPIAVSRTACQVQRGARELLILAPVLGSLGCRPHAPPSTDTAPGPQLDSARAHDSAASQDTGPPAALGGNVLIILTDDIGIDKTAVYGEHSSPSPTPHIDALAAQGVLFRNAYASPTCSPSRASLLTGRLPTRHGIGRWIWPGQDDYVLPEHELTIPEMLAQSPQSWTCAWMGKWHVNGFEDQSDPAMHPLTSGFDHHAGSLGNPGNATDHIYESQGYFLWEKAIDGEVTWSEVYMTVDTIDDAIAQLETLTEPWYLQVATNAAHLPLAPPPEDIQLTPVDGSDADADIYDAMVEVADDQLGRLLDAMGTDLRDRTTIIYASDNGTDPGVIRAPWSASRGKGTIYEGGVNVPLIITGPLVEQPGTQSDALVHLVDIFPTMAEIAGVDVQGLTVPSGVSEGQPLVIDGLSLVPYLRDPDTPSQRDVVYTEHFFPNSADDEAHDWHSRTVLDTDWKLVVKAEDGVPDWSAIEFFAFEDGAYDEGEDLLSSGDPLTSEQAAAYGRLLSRFGQIESELSYGH